MALYWIEYIHIQERTSDKRFGFNIVKAGIMDRDADI
jgi:hypothetical protein